MKFIWIFIGLIALNSTSYVIVESTLEAKTGFVVLAIQGSVIITFLFYLVVKENKK
ncbi:hypothetical protein ABE021_10705 [Sporosarcina gallistercoris]|uniref:hypothetical protein n=1 Tax=Sporosarcina gallistercoris TaxID=2762245 RepID=UPI003D280624